MDDIPQLTESSMSWMTFINQHMGDVAYPSTERHLVNDISKEKLKEEAFDFMRGDAKIARIMNDHSQATYHSRENLSFLSFLTSSQSDDKLCERLNSKAANIGNLENENTLSGDKDNNHDNEHKSGNSQQLDSQEEKGENKYGKLTTHGQHIGTIYPQNKTKSVPFSKNLSSEKDISNQQKATNCAICKRDGEPPWLAGQRGVTELSTKNLNKSNSMDPNINRIKPPHQHKVKPEPASSLRECQSLDDSWFYCKTASFNKFEGTRAKVIHKSRKNLQKIQQYITEKLNKDYAQDANDKTIFGQYQFEENGTVVNAFIHQHSNPSSQLRLSSPYLTAQSFSHFENHDARPSSNGSEDDVSSTSINSSSLSVLKNVEVNADPQSNHFENEESEIGKSTKNMLTSSMSKEGVVEHNRNKHENNQTAKRLIIKNLTTFPETKEYEVNQNSSMITNARPSKKTKQQVSKQSTKQLTTEKTHNEIKQIKENCPTDRSFSKQPKEKLSIHQSSRTTKSTEQAAVATSLPAKNCTDDVRKPKAINFTQETITNNFEKKYPKKKVDENVLFSENQINSKRQVQSHSKSVQTESRSKTRLNHSKRRLNSDTKQNCLIDNNSVKKGCNKKAVNHRVMQSNCPFIIQESERKTKQKAEENPKRMKHKKTKLFQTNVTTFVKTKSYGKSSLKMLDMKQKQPTAQTKFKTAKQQITSGCQKDLILTEKLDCIYELAEKLISCLCSLEI